MRDWILRLTFETGLVYVKGIATILASSCISVAYSKHPQNALRESIGSLRIIGNTFSYFYH